MKTGKVIRKLLAAVLIGTMMISVEADTATVIADDTPTKLEETYTIFDACVFTELVAENKIAFCISNDGFATIKDWSISFEADYNIVDSEGVNILDNSEVKMVEPIDIVPLKPGDSYKFVITVEADGAINTNAEYRVYGIFDETSLALCDEEYVTALLESSDFVEYDCETGEERLLTIDPEDIEEINETLPQVTTSVVKSTYGSKSSDIGICSIIGADYRKRITAVREDPYYRIGFLYITDVNDNHHVGTGFLISKNYMLTAAHCVYMSGSPVKSITAYFGADGNSYGMSANGSVFGWCSSYPDNRIISNDWGYIKLNSDVGNTCGWFGIGYTTNDNLESATFAICGYPRDKITYDSGSEMHGQNVQMWRSAGKLTDVYTGYIRYKMDTYNGQSGSPIYNVLTDIVYGIHHGVAVSGKYNGGARITSGIFAHLKSIGACN